MWKQMIRFSDDNSQVIIHWPLDMRLTQSQSLTKDLLLDYLDEIDATDLLFDYAAIDNFLALLRESHPGVHQDHILCRRVDVALSVDLSTDKLLAYMTVVGPYGGRDITGTDIMQAMERVGIKRGINKKALRKVMIMSRGLAPGASFKQPIAKGKEPIHGEGSREELQVKDISERGLEPQKIEGKNKVDMRDLGDLICVDKDQIVVRRIPATLGTDGYDVLGTILPSKDGVQHSLKATQGTYLPSPDADVLLAKFSGAPTIRDGRLTVEPLLKLDNVDIATGHVRFEGCLLVKGSIRPEMKVEVTGTIIVKGFIESAVVKAQGDITVGRGIIGRLNQQGENTCQVTSGGNINAQYAQFCLIKTKSNINLTNYSINNQIFCGGDLQVLDKGETRGTISGGVANVVGSITCLNLGAEGDVPTSVEPFSDYLTYLEKSIKLGIQYQKMLQQRNEGLVNSSGKADVTESYELVDGEDPEQKLMEEWEYSVMDLQSKLLKRVVTIKRSLYDRVTVRFGEDVYLTKLKYGPGRFIYDQNKIQFKPSIR